MALFRRNRVWWYEFLFARRRVRESAKTTSKTVARLAEQKRRRELEQGFNGFEDLREERVRSVSERAGEYLASYRLRHRSVNFAEHAVGHVTRHLGKLMVVDVNENTVTEYQAIRVKETCGAKIDQRGSRIPSQVARRLWGYYSLAAAAWEALET